MTQAKGTRTPASMPAPAAAVAAAVAAVAAVAAAAVAATMTTTMAVHLLAAHPRMMTCLTHRRRTPGLLTMAPNRRRTSVATTSRPAPTQQPPAHRRTMSRTRTPLTSAAAVTATCRPGRTPTPPPARRRTTAAVSPTPRNPILPTQMVGVRRMRRSRNRRKHSQNPSFRHRRNSTPLTPLRQSSRSRLGRTRWCLRGRMASPRRATASMTRRPRWLPARPDSRPPRSSALTRVTCNSTLTGPARASRHRRHLPHRHAPNVWPPSRMH